MVTFGRFRIATANLGYYRLDGGAMFGTVPKTIWAGLITPDEDNRIKLATRALLIDAGERFFVVDVGNGNKWPEKLRRIYSIENFAPEEVGLNTEAVTDIIVSHLHFDHAGGLCRYRPGSGEDLELCFPQARVHLQADNYETARNPNARERASYLKENLLGLKQAKLELHRGSVEIFPGIWVHQNDGHTRGQQWIEVRSGAESIVYPADLVPTARHLPLPYSMGYDMSAETLLEEKADFLGRAVAERWIVVFGHDPDVSAARVKLDEKGRFIVGEITDF
jgi:glyoxylase-like metal-dependent hydrolase (beta-lactamase superfamily II)